MSRRPLNGSLEEENAETLRVMKENGDNLSRSRDIDFVIRFFDESSAQRFSCWISRVSVRTECFQAENGAWDVTATFKMVPELHAVGDRERFLAEASKPFGGKVDGWG